MRTQTASPLPSWTAAQATDTARGPRRPTLIQLLAVMLVLALGGSAAVIASRGVGERASGVASAAVSSDQVAHNVLTAGGLQQLPLGVRAPVAAALGAHSPGYRVVAGRALNRDFSARFTRDGVRFSAGHQRFSLALASVGRSGAMHTVASARPVAVGNRVTYARGDGTTEWWANGPLGLEQGFTFAHRPAGSGALLLSVTVPAGARLRDGALRLPGGLTYAGLHAHGAHGRALPVSMVLRGRQLQLRVADQGARYPLSVDPYVETDELNETTAGTDAEFGSAVAAAGNILVVGAPDATVGSGPETQDSADQGITYIFTLSGGTASLAATVTADDGEAGDEFGSSVAIDQAADTIVVGAPDRAATGSGGTGLVYVLTPSSPGDWSDPTEVDLSSTDTTSDGLGTSVAISPDGTVIAAGAPVTQTDGYRGGAVFEFSQPSGGVWQDATQTKALTSTATDSLGMSVAATDNTIVGGAPAGPGAFVFQPSTPGDWATATQTAWLHDNGSADSSANATSAPVGFSVAISADGSTIATGASDTDSCGNGQQGYQGLVDVYTLPEAGWANTSVPSATLTAAGASEQDNGACDGDEFYDLLGSSLAMSPDGTTIVAGASGSDVDGTGSTEGGGAVFVFDEPTSGGWSTAESVVPPLLAGDAQAGESLGGYSAFSGPVGAAVAIDGSTIIAGAPKWSSSSDTPNTAGAAYIFGTGAPSVAVQAPAEEATYTQGQTVDASYTCTAGANSTLSSCVGTVDDGAPFNTSTLGSNSFTVTATDADGQSTVDTVTYTVAAAGSGSTSTPSTPTATPSTSTSTPSTPAPTPSVTKTTPAPAPTKVLAPSNLRPPVITGTVKADATVHCAMGLWSNDPTSYTYTWAVDGTPIPGATSSGYTVQAADEGLTLTCTVTASNAAGAGAPATSAGVPVPVPTVKGCPAATGALKGSQLGLVKLLMTRKQARTVYSHSSTRGRGYEDFFCLTPIGVRVGYGSPKLLELRHVSDQYVNHVIWASTSNGRYTLKGLRVRVTVAVAKKVLTLSPPIQIGLNTWYLASNTGTVAGVLKVRHGIVEEIGIAVRSLALGTLKQERAFLSSFT